MSDIGNRCVDCGKDTSFGSGRFVNRIPADADYESIDEQGKTIFAAADRDWETPPQFHINYVHLS